MLKITSAQKISQLFGRNENWVVVLNYSNSQQYRIIAGKKISTENGPDIV